MNWAKTAFISVISLLVIGLFIGIGIWIYSEIEFNRQNVITPAKGKILFSSIYREEPYPLFLLENGNIRPVIDNDEHLSDYNKLSAKGLSRIVTRDKKGKIIKEVIIPAYYDPFDFDISPDGQTIVFTSKMGEKNAPYNLYTIGIEGKNLRKITDFKQSSWSVGEPKFSPDGHIIVFSGPKTYHGNPGIPGIWVVNSDGTKLRDLTGDAHWGGAYPSWSHDSKKIVFSSYESTDKPFFYNLYTMNADGSEIRRLTNFHGDLIEPVFSPDDKQICFVFKTRGQTAGSELFAINTDGTNLIRLTPAKRISRYPYFATDQSPDWGE